MPEVSDGSLGIIAMIVAMFPDMVPVTGELKGSDGQGGTIVYLDAAGKEAENSVHGRLPEVGLIMQEDIVQTPEQMIANMQNKTMTTMHAAEVWQGGGHTGFAAERTLAEDRTSKRYAGQRAEASKKSGDGRTGFAA